MLICLIYNLREIGHINRYVLVYELWIDRDFPHNLADFIFSCPAYLVAFYGSLFLIAKLYQLEKFAALSK